MATEAEIIASNILASAIEYKRLYDTTKKNEYKVKEQRLRQIAENIKLIVSSTSSSSVSSFNGRTGAVILSSADVTGALGYTPGDMLKSIYDYDNDGVVDSAERTEIIVRNSTGSTLTKGTVVYLSGATGNRPNALRAQANSEATSSKTFGFVVSDIANNSDGYVACAGTLHDLDTSAFADGVALWLSPSVAGGWTTTVPSEPNHSVFLGYVARSHPTQGRIVILIQNGYELNELHDVYAPSPTNGDLLQWDSANAYWKNVPVATAVPTPTLATVTTAGNTTTNNITVGTLTTSKAAGNILIQGFNATENAFSYKLYNSGSGTLNSAVFTQSLDYSGSTNGYISFARGGGGTDGFLTFGDNGGERMRLAYGGNLGIGTTSPNSRLQVAGLSIFTNSVGTNYNENIRLPEATTGYSSIVMGGAVATGGTGTTVWSILKQPSANGHRFSIRNNGTDYLTILTNGNVGIGTTSPSYKLQVDGSVYFNGSTNDFYVDGVSRFGGTNSYTTVITNSGSIGVGTNSPTYKLDVNGTARISNNFTVEGTFSYVKELNATRYFQIPTGVPTNNLGTPTITEMALFDEQFDNKTAFYPTIYGSTILTFETYNGTTWTDISSTLTDTQKKQLFGGDGTSSIAIPYGTVQYQITINNPGPYVYLNALYNYWSGNGHNTQVHIWKKHNSGSWVQHTNSTTTVSSWPGHLYLPFSTIPWHPAGTLGTHYNQIRIVYTPTWNVTYPTNNINLYKLQMWGGYPTGKRVIYSTNENRGVGFPADVTATGAMTSVGTFTANSTSTFAQLATFGNSATFNNAAGTSAIRFQHNGTNRGILGTDAAIYGVSTANVGLYVYGANDLELSTNNVKRIIAKANGNILIGTTTDSGYLLQVNGTTNLTGALNLNGIDQTDLGFMYPYRKTVNLPTATVESWYKIATTNIGIPHNIKFRININGDNTSCNDEFVVTAAGYNMPMNIMLFPTAIYNTSKLVEIRAINTTMGTVEVWIRVLANTLSTDITVRGTVPLENLVGTTTAPTNTAGSTAMIISNATRSQGLNLSRGIVAGGDVSVAGKIVLNTNNIGLYGKTTGGSELEILKLDSTNNLVVGTVFNGAPTVFYTGTLYDWYQYPSSVTTHRMRLASSGNLLINTTTDAGYRLDVNGTARVQGNLTVTNGTISVSGGDVTTNYSMQLGNHSSGRYIGFGGWTNYIGGDNTSNYLVFNTNSSEKMRITSSGNVGIGIAAPTDKLHIVDSSNANIFGRITATGTNASAAWVAMNNQNDNVVYRVFGDGVSGSQMGISLVRSASLMANLGGSGKFLLGTYSATDFVMGTGNAEKIRIVDSTGNFLIGTTSDNGNKLQVNGTIDGQAFALNGVNGWTGTIMIATNPPGMQNIDVQSGIIMNVF